MTLDPIKPTHETVVITLRPEMPFVWPALDVAEGLKSYDSTPPFAHMISSASWLFGVMPGLTHEGVALLAQWLKANPVLTVLTIVVVYPACGVTATDLQTLSELTEQYPERLFARILPLKHVSHRSIHALCSPPRALTL